MPKLRRRRRAPRAALGLAVLLALGFAADAVVLVTAHARADGTPAAGESPKSRQTASAKPSEDEDKPWTSRQRSFAP